MNLAVNLGVREPTLAASSELVLTNAKVVLGDAVVTGTVCVDDGRITAIDDHSSYIPSAIDFDGDYLLPGLVELHTDNLERHFSPRPGVVWPSLPAVIAHDAEIAASGITTVFDALRLGTLRGDNEIVRHVRAIAGCIADAQDQHLLRASHLFHMRCEVSCDDAASELSAFVDNPLVRLVSIMDHTPGQRQFTSMDKYREYFGGKYGLNEKALAEFVEQAIVAQARNSDVNRRTIVDLCHQYGLALASHDDATTEHVSEAVGDGMIVAEFPTTVEAAQQSSQQGLKVLMGAPNVVRGGSHSGNVSASDLAERGLLNILSSDYVPASLLHAAFKLSESHNHIDLPEAVSYVSRVPAQAAGLDDRGEISVGKRADIIRVRRRIDTAIVSAVWRAGNRVS